MFFMTIICGMLTILSYPALAEHHEHRELGAHEHGVGSLKLVMEGKQLKAYLESPTINLLGFEHKPDNADEKARFDSVLNQLQQKNQVIDIHGGECKLTNYQISNPFEKVTGEEEHTAAHEHSDFDVEYLFSCQQPLALKSITISLFDSFTGFHSLNAQWIINSSSGAAVFDKNQHLLKVN